MKGPGVIAEGVATWTLLRELRQAAHRTAAALSALQGALLRVAVAHAYQRVPFYRHAWDEAGVDPTAIRGIDDLSRLPILTSAQVRAAAARGELLARDTPRGLPSFPTSGTSGPPLLVPRGDIEARVWRCGGLRLRFEHGLGWRDPAVQFDPPASAAHPLQHLGMAPSTWIDPRSPLEDQVARFTAAAATIVLGTPTRLRRICRELEAAGLAPKPVRAVFCQGEILDRESATLIRRVLGVEPVGAYGTSEVGYIGWQCERRGDLHVNAELVAVEVIGEPGELGRVVVTDLRGRTMPLLRWDTGDLAGTARAACGCGRSLPTIGLVEGRASRALVSAKGRVVSARMVLDALAGTLSVDEYLVGAAGADRFVLHVAAAADRAACEVAVGRLRALLGAVEVEVRRGLVAAEGDKTHVIAA